MASKFYQQSCEEGVATFGGREAPIQYLGQGFLNGQDYGYDTRGVCDAHGSVTG